jgi:apolipoprotein D and lipocalin family protein
MKVSILAVVLLMCHSFAALAEPAPIPVDRQHYTGKWLEIGRRPMIITDGCVAGYTIYRPGPTPKEVAVEDGCTEGTPSGELKRITGKGTITNYGDGNGKLRVRYPFLITFDYWVLYKSPDARWFISSDKRFYNLWIYSRDIPSRKELARMVGKAKELGYDVGLLEFPPHR